MTECVYESCFQKIRELGAFLVCEPRIHAVAFRVLQVDFIMRDVEVSAYDDTLALRERAQVCPEVILPLHPVVKSLEAVLSVRNVYADQVEILHLHRYHTTLVVVLVDSDAVCH